MLKGLRHSPRAQVRLFGFLMQEEDSVKQKVVVEERLIVGLGNPEEEYADTRHNLGFACVRELARRLGVSRPALIEKLHKYGLMGT